MAKVRPWVEHHMRRYENQPGGADFEDVKGSWRAAEAWYCVAVLESTKRALDRLLVNVWLEPKTPAFWRCQCCGMIT